MKTSSCKAKGRKACQDVKNAILERYPQLGQNDIIVASSGQNGEDLIFSPKARKLLPLSFEVKNREALNIWKSHEQAAQNAGNSIPVLAYTRNRHPLYVSMALVDFLDLIKPSVLDT